MPCETSLFKDLYRNWSLQNSSVAQRLISDSHDTVLFCKVSETDGQLVCMAVSRHSRWKWGWAEQFPTWSINAFRHGRPGGLKRVAAAYMITMKSCLAKKRTWTWYPSLVDDISRCLVNQLWSTMCKQLYMRYKELLQCNSIEDKFLKPHGSEAFLMLTQNMARFESLVGQSCRRSASYQSIRYKYISIVIYLKYPSGGIDC